MASEPLARCASAVERAVLAHQKPGVRQLGALGGPPADQPLVPLKNLHNRPHRPAGCRGSGARTFGFGVSSIMSHHPSHGGLSTSRLSLACRNQNLFAKGRAYSSGQSIDRVGAESQGPLGLWGSQSWWDDFHARTAMTGNVGAGVPAESGQLPSLDLKNGLPVKCRIPSSNPNSPLSPRSPQSPDGFEWYVSAHHCAIVAAVRDELSRITEARLGEKSKNCQQNLGFDPISAFSAPTASARMDPLKSPTTISTPKQDGIILRILHVGCGTSSLGDAIAKLPLPPGVRGIQVTNIDMSPVAINYMKQRATTLAAEEVELLGEEEANVNKNNHLSFSDYDVADIRRLPYADRTYDLIVDKGTLDAIVFGECDVRGAMCEMTRVLLPDGAILSLSSDPPEVRWELLQETSGGAQWGWWEVRRSELDPDEWLYHLYRGRLPSSPPSTSSTA